MPLTVSVTFSDQAVEQLRKRLDSFDDLSAKSYSVHHIELLEQVRDVVEAYNPLPEHPSAGEIWTSKIGHTRQILAYDPSAKIVAYIGPNKRTKYTTDLEAWFIDFSHEKVIKP